MCISYLKCIEKCNFCTKFYSKDNKIDNRAFQMFQTTVKQKSTSKSWLQLRFFRMHQLIFANIFDIHVCFILSMMPTYMYILVEVTLFYALWHFMKMLYLYLTFDNVIYINIKMKFLCLLTLIIYESWIDTCRVRRQRKLTLPQLLFYLWSFIQSYTVGKQVILCLETFMQHVLQVNVYYAI